MEGKRGSALPFHTGIRRYGPTGWGAEPLGTMGWHCLCRGGGGLGWDRAEPRAGTGAGGRANDVSKLISVKL